ncbi:Aste57867_21875 [Aphanomyces stellatus]|uniref:Aste57867_21875 protein n=1 Tax=Aphanomyces stellatus TaxID=120398 RepID=A0A485LIP2_9STRA|nr:hypothetical protein As57867_021806 [Aphanomyces stellatus]VFT98543.1 Aste57867_21875 [Aphanomyces stellatus]
MVERVAVSQDVVLSTPELVHAICSYQPGIPEDFLVFQSIFSSSVFYHNADEVNPIMESWLAKYGLVGIPLLVKGVLHYAADHGRVDILQLLHTKMYDLDSSSILFELAAAKGHLTVVEFLASVFYRKYRLDKAAQVALDGGHTPILQFMLRWHNWGRAEWITDEDVQCAIQDHQAEALEFVLTVWFPAVNPTMTARALPKVLDQAARAGKLIPIDAYDVLSSALCGQAMPESTSWQHDDDWKRTQMFLDTYNVTFHRPLMLSVLAAYVENAKHIDWAAMKTNVDSLVTYCVARFIKNLAKEEDGGDAAVLGRIVQYMLVITTNPPRVALLRKVCKIWGELAEDDAAKSAKRKIEREMLEEATAAHRTKWIQWLVQETTGGSN